MPKISWGELMRLGLVELRLSPEGFWALTPAELMMMLGLENASRSLSRGSFAKLAARFPDITEDE